MRCPNCNAQIDDDSVFCYACGQEINGDGARGNGQHRGGGSIWNTPDEDLEDETAPQNAPKGFAKTSNLFSAKVCPYCGWKIDRNQTLCDRCGKEIPTSAYGVAQDDEDDYRTSLMDDEGTRHSGESTDARQRLRDDVDSAQRGRIDNPTGFEYTVPPAPTPIRKGPNVALIVGIVAGVVAIAVGLFAVVSLGVFAPKEAKKPEKTEPVEETVPGSIYGHLSMSDAEYGTKDYKVAIILDVDDKNNAKLFYRGNDLSGVLKREKESEDTYTYTMKELKDAAGKSLKNATVKIEVPKSFTPDNLAGFWRISYVNKDKKYEHSDWAIVNNDNTGVAGFGGGDIFTKDRDTVRASSSKRKWTKSGKGYYRITAPDKNGVDRIVYVSG